MNAALEKLVNALENLPYGTVIKYRRMIYFKSRGLDADILTHTDGHWLFVHECKWKTFQILFKP